MIRQTRLTPYQLPLRWPWQSAAGSFSERRGWLLEVMTDDGYRGYGDCAPMPSAGTETLPQAECWLRTQMGKMTHLPPQQALDSLPPPGASPAARCAVETALLDLLSQAARKPLYLWLNPNASSSVRVNANLGLLDSTTPSRAEAAINKGFQVLKIKVGRSGVAQELQLLTQLCQTLPTNTTLRLDANRAWVLADAKHFLQGIEGLPIESLEEPLQHPTLAYLADLQALSHCKLALDESLLQIDMTRLLLERPIRRLILKPMVQGGLLPALHLAQHAKAAGIDTVVTTTVDSAAGSWAAAQLAAATATQLHHGVATSGWLAQDIGVSPVTEDGTLSLPPRAGLGFNPN